MSIRTHYIIHWHSSATFVYIKILFFLFHIVYVLRCSLSCYTHNTPIFMSEEEKSSYAIDVLILQYNFIYILLLLTWFFKIFICFVLFMFSVCLFLFPVSSFAIVSLRFSFCSSLKLSIFLLLYFLWFAS